MNTLDIVFIVILALATLNGFRAGLLAGISKLVGVAVGLAVAIFYCRPVGSYIDGYFNIAEKVGPLISSMIELPIHVSGENISGFIGNSLTGMCDVLAANNCMFIEKLIELLQVSTLTIEEALGDIITFTVLDIVVFIVILIMVEKLIVMLGYSLSRVLSYTFVGIVDRIGGGIFGVARGIITIMILIAILIPLQAFGGIVSGGANEGFLYNLLQNSKIVGYLGYAAEYLSSHFLQSIPPANLI